MASNLTKGALKSEVQGQRLKVSNARGRKIPVASCVPTPDVPQYDGSGGGIRRYWSLDCIVRIDNSAGPDAIVQTEIVCPGPKLRGWEDGTKSTGLQFREC